MKRFYRIDYKGTPRYVVDEAGEWRLIEGDIFGSFEAGQAIRPTGHRLLAPVIPSKIVAVGLNYKDHAAEQNKPLPAEPMIFIKPSTAVIGPDDPIVIPEGVGRVDHEAEVGVVIGTPAWRVRREEAPQYVFGLTCVNDVTARELQTRLGRIFLADAAGRRPCHGGDPRWSEDPHWRDLVLFHEYFHGDTGRGVGASHQTGWTALAIRCLEDVARLRSEDPGKPAVARRIPRYAGSRG